MNRFKKEGLVPTPGRELKVRWFRDEGGFEIGTAIMGKKSFVVDRFTVDARFPSMSFPETYYCDEHGVTWLYADEPLPTSWRC